MSGGARDEETGTRAGAATGADAAAELIDLLAADVGPRRPTSRAERLAAEVIGRELEERGATVALEPFSGYSTFAAPYGAVLGLGIGAGLVPRRHYAARAALALGAVTLGALEDGLRHRLLSRALARRPSVNLVAGVEPSGPVRRTLCLVSHLDSSRSGLIFDPRLLPHLRTLLTASSISTAVQGLEPVLGRSASGRGAVRAARAYLALSLALLIERELRGEDVPGANDNASGVALCATLLAEAAASPPQSTRLVMLATGCEESGVLGAERFANAHPEAGDWIYLNFDGVGAPATLRYLRREGLVRKWTADPALIALCDDLSRRRPELGLEPSDGEAGLTYDATPLLARGRRAITLGVSNGVIPNYHWPTDTAANIDRDVLARSLEVGRELIAAVERGEAG